MEGPRKIVKGSRSSIKSAESAAFAFGVGLLRIMRLQSLMLRTIDRYVIREVIPPFFLSPGDLYVPSGNPRWSCVTSRVPVAKGVSLVALAPRESSFTLIPQALGLTIPMPQNTGLLIGLAGCPPTAGRGRPSGVRCQPLPAAPPIAADGRRPARALTSALL